MVAHPLRRPHVRSKERLAAESVEPFVTRREVALRRGFGFLLRCHVDFAFCAAHLIGGSIAEARKFCDYFFREQIRAVIARNRKALCFLK